MAAVLLIAGYEMRNCEIDNNFVTYLSAATRQTEISSRPSVSAQISSPLFRLLITLTIATREKSFVARVPPKTCRVSLEVGRAAQIRRECQSFYGDSFVAMLADL